MNANDRNGSLAGALRHGAVTVMMALACGVGPWATATAQYAGRSQPKIEVRVEPRRVALNDSAELVVTVPGGSRSAPVVPPVDGLRIEQRGRSHRIEFDNGVRSESISWQFEVVPQRKGTFTIPAIAAESDGRTLRSAPVAIDVVDPARGGTSGGASGGASGAATGGAGDEPGLDRGDLPFLRIVPAATELLVGQRVPVEIRAYFPEGVRGSLETLPSLAGTAFTLEKIEGDAERSRARVGQKIYTVLTWRSALAPVKAGEFVLDGQMDATLVLPERAPRRPRMPRLGGSLFDDSFFDDAMFGDDLLSSFFSRGRERKVTLRAVEPPTVSVAPLPRDGQPDDFDGAVGRFTLSTRAHSTHVVEGDPITLEATVRGQGNFDRVTAPRLADADGWKVYSPTARFEPLAADSGFTGEKTFTMSVVPQSARVTEIPAMTFSYHDTERGEFVTLRSEPIPVRVDAAPDRAPDRRSDAASTTPAGRGDAASPGPIPAEAESAPAPDLQPNRFATGTPGRIDAGPLWTRNWFHALLLLALGGIATGLLFSYRRRRLADDPELRARLDRQRAVRAALREIDAAIDAEDSSAFAEGCRRTLEAAIGRTPAGGAGPLRPILSMADSVAFAGRKLDREEMGIWKLRLTDGLKDMEVIR